MAKTAFREHSVGIESVQNAVTADDDVPAAPVPQFHQPTTVVPDVELSRFQGGILVVVDVHEGQSRCRALVHVDPDPLLAEVKRRRGDRCPGQGVGQEQVVNLPGTPRGSGQGQGAAA
ncbi:MAG: hypothetical protein GH143_00280 [Calditrichaeota bacterium]|nr:hypothetical protein [Calditrichota bacterium]